MQKRTKRGRDRASRRERSRAPSRGHALAAFSAALPGARSVYVAAFAAIMFSSFFSLADPIVIRIALDTVIGGKPLSVPAWFDFLMKPFGGAEALARGLLPCALAMVGLNAASGVFLFFKGWMGSKAAERAAFNLRNRLYAKLSRLPFGYFSSADSGDLIQRCTSDVDTIRRFLDSELVEVGRSVFMVAFALAMMLSLDARLTAVSVVLVPAIFLWSFLFFLKVQKQFLKTDKAESAMTGVIQENLHGIRVVRAFAREDRERSRFDGANRGFRDVVRGLVNLMGTYWSVSACVTMLQMALVLAVGSWMAGRGMVSSGTVVMFFAYVGRFL